MSLEIEVATEGNVVDNVLKLLGKALDTQEIIDEASALLLNRIRTNFLKQVSPDGKPWKPSLAATRRRRIGRGGGTLFDSGRLFRSIQLATHGKIEAKFISDTPYGQYHNDGQGQERREFFGWSQADSNLALQVVIKRIEQVLK